MSSKPTSDDAAETARNRAADNPSDKTEVIAPADNTSGEQAVEFSKPAPGSDDATTVLPGRTDPPTEVIGAARTDSPRHTDSPQHTAYPVDGGATEVVPTDGPTEVVSADGPTEVVSADAATHAASRDAATQAVSRDAAANDDATQVIPGSGQQPEWWQQGEAARLGTGDTAVMGAHAAGPHPTEALDPAEAAAYAAGAGSVPAGDRQPPGTPPPPEKVGGQGGPSGRKPKRRTLLIIGLVLALIVVGGLAGGEAYARQKIDKCISSQFEQQMGSKIDVSFGWKPLLITMIDGKVGSATVDSDDTKFGPAVGMKVHAVFNDIEVKDGGKQGGTIGSSTAEVDWSNEGIKQTLSGLITGATSDPSKGTLSFAVLGGLAELQVQPKVIGDKVQVETVSASLLGFGLPTDLVSGIVELMTESLQTYPLGLKPTKVQVTGDGLHVSLAGGQTQLEAAEGQNTDIRC
ncbi:DUF2993 domain-containing protein [Nocardia jejuensis]|uniref:DUF2993 domain-containing protein n=1 Tax=Nocardia jejuensis TaxID=328049 RepID=UPI000B317E4A|nr:DUF2993 domain-containing protein [Nocardia jejuensis]